MKLKIIFAVSTVIVIIASLLAIYADNDIGRYILFPGLMIEVIITGNIHTSGFLGSALILIASWLVWSFVLYLGVEIFSKILHSKK
jgi:hypothetical protein